MYLLIQTIACSGDHDLSIPHIGTREWIQSLNMSNDEYWQPWSVDGQVSGWVISIKFMVLLNYIFSVPHT